MRFCNLISSFQGKVVENDENKKPVKGMEGCLILAMLVGLCVCARN